MFNLINLRTIVFIAISCFSCTQTFGASTGDYELGLLDYKKGDYGSAVQHFRAASSQNLKNKKLLLLYLGHSYVGTGQLIQARRTYNELVAAYPGSQEARLAGQSLQSLSSNSNPLVKSSTNKLSLVDRIVIVPPNLKLGHKPVSPSTIDTVKSAVRRLPTSLYSLLDAGGATINISPGRTDKWPEDGDKMIEGEGITLGEVPGHTFHREGQGPDIYIFERSTIRGSSQLKEPYPTDEIFRITLHELGHGVDDLKHLSTDASFKAAHKDDVADLDADERSSFSYYCEPMEACCEIFGGLAGLNQDNSTTAGVIKNFPRCTAWLKNKLHL